MNSESPPPSELSFFWRHSSKLSYGIAILVISAAFLLQKLLWLIAPGTPFLFFYPAIFLSAWSGGRRAGLLAAGLSAFLISYAFLPPYNVLKIGTTGDFLRWGVLFFTAFWIGTLRHRFRQAYHTAWTASERLRNLVDWLDHAIVWEIDAQTWECSFISKGTERHLNIPMRDWYEKPGLLLELIHPDDRNQFKSNLQRAIHETTDDQCDHRLISADGKATWYHTGFHIDREGNSIKARGITVNIARLKTAEEQIKESERLYRELAQRYASQIRIFDTITSTIPDFIYLFNTQHQFTYASPSLLKLWGKRLEEIIGKTFLELEYPPSLVELHERQLNEVLRTRKPVRGENEYTNPEGRTGYYEYIFSPVIGSSGEVEAIAGTTRDFTERKKVEKKLTEAVQNREEVIAILSHDLKNPLSSLLMAANLIKRKSPLTPEYALTQADKIHRAGQRMNDILEDLLSVYKIEKGRLEVSTQGITIRDIIFETLEVMKPLASQKSIQIHLKESDSHIKVQGDAVKLLRVFSNLLNNAIKFTPEKGVVEISVQESPSDVIFGIVDTGPGIAPEHLPHIFDRFWQAKKTAHLGSGLGLFISKGIIEAHGGQIWVESPPGQGARFHFSIPKVLTKIDAA